MENDEAENEEPKIDTAQPGLPVAPQKSLLTTNLAPLFLADAKEFTERWAARVVAEDREDRESAKEYMEMRAEAIASYVGKHKKAEKGPAAGENMAHIPLFAKIVNRSHARQMSLISSTEPIPVPTGDEDSDRAQRVSKHLAWEKRFKYADWTAGMEVTSLQRLFGSAFRYVGWDAVEGKRCHVALSIRDISLPYTAQDYTADLREVDHYTITWRYAKQKIVRLGRRGHYHEADRLFADDEPQKAQQEHVDSDDPIVDALKDGYQPDPQSGKSGRYELLERHGWESLPASVDSLLGGTGVPRRMAITVEKSSKRVLRIVLMEDESQVDRLRFENDLRRASAERDAMAEAAGVLPDMAAQLPLPWQPEPIVTEPVFPVFHYPFMRNPEGLYGLGVWAFVGGTNQLVDELATEDLVGERIRNVLTGFVPRGSTVQKGDIELKYGKFNELEAADGDISRAYSLVEWPPRAGGILQYINLLDEQVQAAMSSSDQQSGLPGPSHETRIAAQMRGAASQTAMTAALEMFLIPLAAEYKFYARINAAHISEPEYFFVTEVDPATSMPRQRQASVSPDDYRADYDITFESDFRLELDPGLGEAAMQAYGLIKDDPNASPNMKLAAFKKVLRSLRQRDLAAMLPDEVPPPEPPQPMSQEDENAAFLNERDHPVLPDDPDGDHLQKMDEFEQAGLYNELSYVGRQNFDRHKRAHKAAAYQKGERLRQQAEEMNLAADALTTTLGPAGFTGFGGA